MLGLEVERANDFVRKLNERRIVPISNSFISDVDEVAYSFDYEWRFFDFDRRILIFYSEDPPLTLSFKLGEEGFEFFIVSLGSMSFGEDDEGC